VAGLSAIALWLVLLVLPGMSVGLLLRLPRHVAAAAAAPITFGLVGAATPLYGVIGVRWNPWTAGALLLASALEQPQGVERGALVTLIASNATVQVKAEGVALEPGRLKERVRVRSASGRVVEGVVEAPGQVRVGF